MSEFKLTALQLEEGLALLRAFDIQKVMAELLPVVGEASTVKGALAKILLQGEAGMWNTLFSFLAQAGYGSLLRETVLIKRSDTATLRKFKTDAAAKDEALWALADEPAEQVVKEAVVFFSVVVPTLRSALPSSVVEAPAMTSPVPAPKRTSTKRGRK